jgi:hypothetical protein
MDAKALTAQTSVSVLNTASPPLTPAMDFFNAD